MSVLLDFHTLPGSSEPPPYSAAGRDDTSRLTDLGLPSSIAGTPHRYYPMPSRLEGAGGDGSLFSPETESTMPSSFHGSSAYLDSDLAHLAAGTGAAGVAGAGEAPLTEERTNESSLLPSYTTGAQVTPNVNLARDYSDTLTSALTLRVTNTPANGRAFDVGELIQGIVMFAPWQKPQHSGPWHYRHQEEQSTQRISAVSVALQCTEVSMADGGSVAGAHRAIRLVSHVVPDLAMPPDGAAAVGYIYSFPFSVQVPEVRQSPETPERERACNCKAEGESEGEGDGFLHTTLPPTFPGGNLDALNETGRTLATARVRYQLCAVVRGPQDNTLTGETKTVTVCKTLHDVPITPSYTLPQVVVPGEVEAVAKGQAVIKAKQGGSGLFKANRKAVSGLLKAELSLPPLLALPLTLALDQSFSTVLPLDLVFQSSNSAGSMALPQIESISVGLLARTTYTASTFSRSSGGSKPISLQSARLRKPSLIKTGYLLHPLSQLDLSTQPQPHWSMMSDAGTGGFKTTVQVPLEWSPGEDAPPPGFKSCTIEREYKLAVSVHVRGVKLAAVKVQAPVRVVTSFRPRSVLTAP